MPQPLRLGVRQTGQTGTYLLIVGLIAAIFAVVLGGTGWLVGSTIGGRPIAGLAVATVAVFAVAAFCVPVAAVILRNRYAELDGTVLTVRTLTTKTADLATAPKVWLAATAEATGYASSGRRLAPTGERPVPVLGVRNESGGSLAVRLQPLTPTELRALAKALKRNPSTDAREVARWLNHVAGAQNPHGSE
ncbi:hypothetical protein [Fodinicola acaciae]|uniref:hypothetical protein n=1 Tax=Fodinicola acaciae TaxID=2681555 RepID=UPI0013D20C3D|nr:hypothetical protein [Fodinicola acaciae]